MTDTVVKDTPKLDAALVIIRYVMFAIGNVLIVKGWANAEQWAMISGGVLTAIPPIYGAFNAFRNKKVTVAIASGAPVIIN